MSPDKWEELRSGIIRRLREIETELADLDDAETYATCSARLNRVAVLAAPWAFDKRRSA
ncbi:MAG: hypothetical protein AAGA99_27830 [Actinomycetota bacterium]